MSEWMQQRCTGPAVRWLGSGAIEIEGEGVPDKPLPARVYEWRDIVFRASDKWEVPASYIAGTIAQESLGDPDIVSFDHGVGLMQITDPSLKVGYTEDQLKNPELNVDIGTRVLRKLLDLYGQNPISASFAYNAGSARCGAAKSSGKNDKGQPCAPNRWNLYSYCSSVAAGTNDYGGRVLRYTNYAASHGFAPGDWSPPAPPPDEISAVSEEAGTGRTLLLAAGFGLIGYFGYQLWKEYR